MCMHMHMCMHMYPSMQQSICCWASLGRRKRYRVIAAWSLPFIPSKLASSPAPRRGRRVHARCENVSVWGRALPPTCYNRPFPTEPALRSRRECELSRAARPRAHCYVEDRVRSLMSIACTACALHAHCMHCVAHSDEWTCGALAVAARSATSSFKVACLVASTPSSAARSSLATPLPPLHSRIALQTAFGFEGSACRRHNRRRCAQETSSVWDRPPGAQRRCPPQSPGSLWSLSRALGASGASPG